MVSEPAVLDRQPAMTLSKLISDMGDAAAAALFGVKLRTVQSWRRRERYPRPEMAWKIVEKAGGRVDYAGIFGPPSPAAAANQDQL